MYPDANVHLLATFDAILSQTTADAQNVPSLVIAHAPIVIGYHKIPSVVQFAVLHYASFLVRILYYVACFSQFDRPTLRLLSVTALSF